MDGVKIKERAVIGAMLTDITSTRDFPAILEGYQFQDNQCRCAFNYINKHRKPDQISEMISHPEKAGLKHDDLLDFIDDAVKSNYIARHWAQDLATVKNREKQKEYAGLIKNAVESEDLEQINEVMGDIHENMAYHTKQQYDVKSIADEIRMDLIKNKTERQTLSTGYKYLDFETGGYLPGQHWVIGGWSGTGKSKFMINQVYRLYKHNKPKNPRSIIFSLELSKKINLQRFVGCICGYTERYINDSSKHTEQQHREIHKALWGAEKANQKIYDTVVTLDEIYNIAHAEKLQNGLDIIFIDYIQNIASSHKDIFERIAGIMPRIYNMAKELDITVVSISQISTESAKHKPDILLFKGGGAITENADVGILLERKNIPDMGDHEKRELSVQIKKNRFGTESKKNFIFTKNFTQLHEEGKF